MYVYIHVFDTLDSCSGEITLDVNSSSWPLECDVIRVLFYETQSYIIKNT